MSKNNIVLIGMPGAGKSTMGVVAAKVLGYEFVDGDILIQSQCDKTLQKIIDAMGPEGFIKVEDEVLSSIDCERTVIAPGGSAIYSEEAMRHLGTIGHIVYLKVSLESLSQRLGGLHERGVVMRNGMGMSLAEIYEERIPLYEKYAEITVDVDGLDTNASARKLVDELSKHGIC